VQTLDSLRCASYAEASWGYHFDVQTRVFFYPQTQPNTIATAFAGLALLDAFDSTGDSKALDLAVSASDFFTNHVPQTKTPSGAYFGYLPGDRTPIHNANMLVCALLARVARLLGCEELADQAAAGMEYTVTRQRPDGSWPYGEQSGLDWIDGFHTGYVLDSLLTCMRAGVGDSTAEDAWRLGLHFYASNLIEDDGTPRYKPASRYPVDGQCAAQAIQTLSRARPYEPNAAPLRWRVFNYALNRLSRGDGTYAFQRERLWANRAAHPRWVQAPMLVALTHLIASANYQNGASSPFGDDDSRV
jgi:hypothetical protein